MVMTRVFHQLDRGLEERWKRERIGEQRKELKALTILGRCGKGRPLVSQRTAEEEPMADEEAKRGPGARVEKVRKRQTAGKTRQRLYQETISGEVDEEEEEENRA